MKYLRIEIKKKSYIFFYLKKKRNKLINLIRINKENITSYYILPHFFFFFHKQFFFLHLQVFRVHLNPYRFEKKNFFKLYFNRKLKKKNFFCIHYFVFTFFFVHKIIMTPGNTTGQRSQMFNVPSLKNSNSHLDTHI